MTARRRDGETRPFDWVVFLIPLVLGILTWTNGLRVVRSGAGSQDGVPVGMIFFMGSVMLLAGAGDVRMLVSGGVFGAKPHRTTSIAHVLWPVHCGRVFLPWAVKPPAKIAFGSGDRATPSSGFIWHNFVLNTQHPPSDFVDLLDSPSPLHKCIPGKSVQRASTSPE